MNTKELTPEFIENLSYPDFVGFINQWNSPPGAYSTLNKLAIFANLNERSNLLEVGCSTGFSSRELATLTKCRATGFDRSEQSIDKAIKLKNEYAPTLDITYQVSNGEQFEAQEKFSHIMVGGNLAFFPNPESMLSKCVSYLQNPGYLLATPYYNTRQMPEELIKKMHTDLNIPLESFKSLSKDEILNFYSNFEFLYKEENKLIIENDYQIKKYCESVVSNFTSNTTYDNLTNELIFERLFNIRKLINETRKYQEYFILVLRYRKEVYPDQLVPLY